MNSVSLPDSVAGPHGFAVGCNYWGSKSGVRMWREDEWDATSIAADLDALAAQGVEMLRVFPTWCDFQPLARCLGYEGIPLGFVREGTDKRIVDPLWLDPGAVSRFRDFAAMAQERGIRLMVSIVTGWMSGRLFAPRMVEGHDLVSDPEAVMWEGRFARAFVRATRDLPAIAAWDLGNEFNCMGQIGSQAKAWIWVHVVASAIRLEDPDRPVAAGMHSQTTNLVGAQYENRNDWTLQMSGELLDILTSHPYPGSGLVPAHKGPFNSFRNALHPVAQCLLQSSATGKPAFPQEIGSLGPCMSPERVAALGMRQQLFTCWQHGLGAYLWWCAFDQTRLRYPPFDDNAMERELGVLGADRAPKPQALALKAFRDFRDCLPFGNLPPRRLDGVCLVSEREHFANQVFGAVMLSKAAGIDLAFQAPETRGLPEASFYVLPSGTGFRTWSQELWEDLLGRVKAGAALLVTRGEGAGFSGWAAATGMEQTLWNEERRIEFEFDGAKLVARDPRTMLQEPVPGGGCEVVARDAGGNVVVARKRLGKGKILVVNFALEKFVAESAPNAVDGDFTNELWRVYAWAAREAGVKRLVSKSDPRLVLTEHPTSDGATLVCALNTRPEKTEFAIDVSGRVGRVWNGAFENGRLRVGGNDGAVFEVL
ncbi:MAG: hypothetical protein IKO40_04220 [Kiritimatiellae bacterium]|nr:hypothetical protein [Kiritimatiellia bacterium]